MLYGIKVRYSGEKRDAGEQVEGKEIKCGQNDRVFEKCRSKAVENLNRVALPLKLYLISNRPGRMG